MLKKKPMPELNGRSKRPKLERLKTLEYKLDAGGCGGAGREFCCNGHAVNGMKGGKVNKKKHL